MNYFWLLTREKIAILFLVFTHVLERSLLRGATELTDLVVKGLKSRRTECF